MLRRVTEGLPLTPPMAIVAVVVITVLQPAYVTTTFLQKLPQEELVMSVIANQVAILRVINKSSSHCTCGVDALREQGMNELQAMNERLLETKMQAMTDQVMTKMRELEERVNSTVEAMDVQIQTMNGNVMTKLEEVEALAKVTFHNESITSLCIDHKELHGDKGILKASVEGYEPYSCSWLVTLPEGTRPVFRWPHFSMLCLSCNCGAVTFWQEGVPLSKDVPLSEEDARQWPGYGPVAGPFCGTSTPRMSGTEVTSNKFRVSFQSKKLLFYSGTRGFTLSYYAVLDV